MDLSKNEKGTGETKDGNKKRSERERILENIKRKEYIPMKILLMLVMSSVGVLLPYLTIHMKSLGITVEETAIIYGVFPLFSVMAPPFMGMAADKIGNFKLLFSAMLALCGLHGILFLAVPTARQTFPYPKEIDMAISCFGTDPSLPQELALQPLEPLEDCEVVDNVISNLTVSIDRCGFICYTNETNSFTEYANSDFKRVEFDNVESMGDVVFVGGNWSLDVSCSKKGETGESCDLIRTWSDEDRNITFYDITEKRSIYVSDVFEYDDGKYSRVKCKSYDILNPIEIISYPASTSEDPSKTERQERDLGPKLGNVDLGSKFQMCRSECLVKVPRSLLCSNMERTEIYDPQLTFWLYLILRVTFKVSIGGVAVLMDGALLALILRYDGDLGIQRLFGVIGLMFFSPISGFLIDYASQGLPLPDFRPAFYMYSGMVFLGALLSLGLQLDFKPPTEKLLKDVRSVLKNVELDIFFVVTFLSGLFWGYIESYLFWFLEDMGASKSLMGLTLTVSGLSGIPMLLFTSPIIRKLGHPNVQVVGFLFYVIRLFGYSYIYDPYMCLVFESLEAFTTALMTTSAVSYAAELSSTTTLTSVQGIVSGIYYGVGRGAGSLLGGFLMKWIGTRETFRVLGIAALGTAIFYFLFNLLYLHCRNRASEKKKKAQEADFTIEGNICGPESLQFQQISLETVTPDENTSLSNSTIDDDEEIRRRKVEVVPDV